jgi:hypothetical protein
MGGLASLAARPDSAAPPPAFRYHGRRVLKRWHAPTPARHGTAQGPSAMGPDAHLCYGAVSTRRGGTLACRG